MDIENVYTSMVKCKIGFSTQNVHINKILLLNFIEHVLFVTVYIYIKLFLHGC